MDEKNFRPVQDISVSNNLESSSDFDNLNQKTLQLLQKEYPDQNVLEDLSNQDMIGELTYADEEWESNKKSLQLLKLREFKSGDEENEKVKFVSLLRTQVDDDICQRMGWPEGTVEYYLTDGAETVQPSYGHDLSREEYQRIFEAMKSSDALYTINDFLKRRKEGGEDSQNLEDLIKILGMVESFSECIYYRQVEAWKKITDPNQLPSFEEVINLLTEIYSKNDPLKNVSLLKTNSLTPIDPNKGSGLFSRDEEIMSELHIYSYWNKELINSLVEEIKKLEIKGSALEICAGDGKLSNSLKKMGIEIRATDEEPINEYTEEFEAKEATEKFQPELVVASWVLPYGKTLKEILSIPSVKYCILFESSSFDLKTDKSSFELVDKSGNKPGKFKVHELPEVEKYYLPVDIFYEIAQEEFDGSIEDLLKDLKKKIQEGVDLSDLLPKDWVDKKVFLLERI